MSRSDRVSIRPSCFGHYTIYERSDRGCNSCKSGIDCIPPQEETTTAGDTKWIEIPYQGDVTPTPTRSKYHREIKPGVWVDVYDVLHAFAVTNSALQHVIKKALAPGQRGHKDRATDMSEIVQSAIRAKELER